MKVSFRLLGCVFLAALTFAIGVAISGLWRVRKSESMPGVLTLKIPAKKVAVAEKPSEPCRINDASITYARVALLRALDFKNLEYPGATSVDHDCRPEKPFRLRRGLFGTSDHGMKLLNISFGDISGDSEEEAIITLDELSDGSGHWSAVYVFALEQQRPRVIYVFEGGDRAQGGLRQAYATDGRLVLELWGPGNTLWTTSGIDKTGLCCPLTFTRSHYRWLNGAFELDGSPENLPNPGATTQCPTCQH